MLRARDKEIIKTLDKFRVMDRDSIAELFFDGVKNPKSAANTVLLRLFRDGQIQRSNAFVPYVYFGPNVEMKKNSAKIAHFLAILDVYKELKALGKMGTFQVEPKYLKKGCAEPDIFCQYRETNFFIEVQRTLYYDKQIKEKLERYVDLFNSGIMAEPFPHIVILTETHYAIGDDYPFKIFQAKTFTEFVQSLKDDLQPEPAKKGIKYIPKKVIGES